MAKGGNSNYICCTLAPGSRAVLENVIFFLSLSRVLQRHNTENSKQILLGRELRGFGPNSYIHVPVSDLNIPLSRSAYSAAGK
jgi:hypothetical protein